MPDKDIFDWLTNAEWLAILRIGVGLWWLESVRHKDLPNFLRGGAMNWVESLTRDHPIPPFANTIRRVSLSSQRRRVVTSWLVVLGESAAGVSLVLGFLTPAGLVLAVFLNANYFLLAGLKDQGEQGQNLMMILSEVVLFATGAGMTWGIDAALFG
ncbi:MAG: DoxX family protein [Chloroflexi bacterium]|nr:DoxX family protein [Chloroflexota bacterium]